ncbi:hypothetical protein D3C73_1442940 [compost metagenome]
MFLLEEDTASEVEVLRLIFVLSGLSSIGIGATPKFISGLDFKIVSAYHGPCTHIAALPVAKAAAASSGPTSSALSVPLAVTRSKISKIAFMSENEP